MNDLNEKENKNQLPSNQINDRLNDLYQKSIFEKKKKLLYLDVASNLSISNSKNVDFGVWFKIRSCFTKGNSNTQKRKIKAYEFLINYFNKRLDLIYYFKRLNKNDLINSFIFTEIQNKTFDYLEKPNIFIDGEITSYEIYEDKSAISDIIKNYSDKVKDENLDYYDQKLLKLLPEKIQFQIV
jgi:hypothetical protein